MVQVLRNFPKFNGQNSPKIWGSTSKKWRRQPSLLFPRISQYKEEIWFMSCLECNLAMVESHDILSDAVKKQGLPELNYRISSDYGKVVVMEPNTLSPMDIIGPPVNMCAKINRNAPKNGVIIGGDMYQMVKDLDSYRYKQTDGFSIGLKYAYPVYTVERKV